MLQAPVGGNILALTPLPQWQHTHASLCRSTLDSFVCWLKDLFIVMQAINASNEYHQMVFWQMRKDMKCFTVNNTTVRLERHHFFHDSQIKTVLAGGVLLFIILNMVTNDTLYILFITKKLLLTAVTGKVKTCNFLWISLENVCSGMCKCKEPSFFKQKRMSDSCFHRLWTCWLCQPASRAQVMS